MHRMPIIGTSGRRSPREWLPALILALLLASSASADVVVKEKSVSEGLGGFGNATTSRTWIVAGDRSRSEDEAAYTGRFKALAGGGKPRGSVLITRIDKGVVWHLDADKQEYTETTFDEMRAMMSSAAEGKDAKGADMTWSVDVKRTGAKQDVNGFRAEQVIITCEGKPRNPEKGSEGAGIRLVMDEWLSKDVPASHEITEYYKRYAAALGVDAQAPGVSAAAQRMYGNGLKELAAKLKDLDGFAVRSTFSISSVGSAEQAQQMEQAQRTADEKSRAAKAKGDEAEAGGSKKDAEDAKDKDDDASALKGGVGGLAGKLGGFLGKKSARSMKKDDGQAEKDSGESTAPGSSVPGDGSMMKVVTDVVSITSSSAPDGSFDVPAGYKLQKRK